MKRIYTKTAEQSLSSYTGQVCLVIVARLMH